MEGGALLWVLAFVILYGAVSRRLERTMLTGPMCFVAFGMLAGPGGLDLVGMDVEQPVAHVLAEVTLVLVLFTDAARIDLRVLRRQLGLPARLLGLGLPLTVLLGALTAWWLFPDWNPWEAALLGVILAPTDPALVQATATSKDVPMRVRQTLNVESGLNDGLALPAVLVCIALAGAGETGESVRGAGEWLAYVARQVTLGPLAGVAVGLAGTFVVRAATARRWMSASFHRLTGLALALAAYALAEALGGNGFIAAFAGGLTFGNATRGTSEDLYGFLDAEGELLMLLVFMLLGTSLALPALREATPRTFAYALLALTVLRMVPVAVALLGAGLQASSLVFLGWFGPRGLASLLFGLLIVEGAELTHGTEIFTTVVVTVVLSVFLHGLTAAPGARAYARSMASGGRAGAHEHRAGGEHPFRHSGRR